MAARKELSGLEVLNSLTLDGHAVWHAGNDGSGSGLDADLLDGSHASAFARLTGATFTGTINAPTVRVGGVDVWHPGNDGSGSGLDADTLDGDHASAFAKLTGATFTGGVTATGFTGPGGGLTGVNAASLGDTAAAGYALLAGATFTGAVQVAGLTNTANTYLGEGLLEAHFGIQGGYGDGNGTGTDWGVPIWSMGDAYMGTSPGVGFVPGTYTLSWLRATAANARSDVGEGLYAYRAGINIFSAGYVGAYFNQQLKVNGNTLLQGLGVGGATPDASNQFAFYGTNLLLNSGGSINMKYNKNAAGNDASLTFQSGFTTHGLVGLLGNNDLTFKVGTGFTTAMVLSGADGTVSFPEGIKQDALTAYKTTTQTLTDTYATLTGWTGTHVAASGNLSWSAANGDAYVGKAGRFLVSYSVSTDVTTGAGRTDSLVVLQRYNGTSWSDVEGTQHRMYNRSTNMGGTNAAWHGVLDLGASDGLRLAVRRETGTDTLIVDSASLSVVRM